MAARNPRLFIGGCPRSGTTLLQRMFDNHHQLAIANDTHFIHRALQKTKTNGESLMKMAGAGETIPLSDSLVTNIRDYHRFYRLGIEQDEFADIAETATSYQELVSELFDRFAAYSDKPFAGEKTPDYVKFVPELLGMFPQAHFINIVRDGRNVALSLLDWASPTKGPGRLEYWSIDPVAVTAMWWREFVVCGTRASTRSDVATVIYEDLVCDSERVLREVCEHVGFQFDSAMLEFHRGKLKQAHGSAKKRWLPPTRNLRDWRTSMILDDQRVFHALAGDQLESLGYEVPSREPTDESTRRIAAARDWWSSNRSEAVTIG